MNGWHITLVGVLSFTISGGLAFLRLRRKRRKDSELIHSIKMYLGELDRERTEEENLNGL